MPCLHLLAMAHDFGVALDDFDRISPKTPVLADLRPWGAYTAPELYLAGGIAVVGKRLLEAGLLNAGERTVTEKASAKRSGAPRNRRTSRSCGR